MKKTEKLFFGIRMTWLRVILFAVLSAVVTAALLIIPGVKDTSLSNIGVSFECWILFAIIIMSNCEKPLEAGLKTFVFFLISQPLIYLLQVPFSWQGWELFRYYPRWFFLTLACFPAAIVGWFIKSRKWYGALILGAAIAFLCYLEANYIEYLVKAFPHYLAASLVTLAIIVVLIAVFVRGKAGVIITAAAVLTGLAFFAYDCANLSSVSAGASLYLGEEHTWEIVEDAGDVAELSFRGTADGSDNIIDSVFISGKNEGTEKFTLRNEAGEEITYTVVYDGESVQVDEVN